MDSNPIMILLYVGAAAFVLHMYWGDYIVAKSGQIRSGAMPGAENASLMSFFIATLEALILLGAETCGEIALGLVNEQSEMLWYFLPAIVAAGVIEEVIFVVILSLLTKVRHFF